MTLAIQNENSKTKSNYWVLYWCQIKVLSQNILI